MNTILGAGLSGLICGALNAQARIYERNSSSFVEHRAVLRFRDDKIFRSLGLPCRKVTVRKAIWYDDKEVSPTPRIANYYSLKVRSVLTDNSIWSIAPSERIIAPDNLHSILADICGNRVTWNYDVTIDEMKRHMFGKPIVSTIPIPKLLLILDVSPHEALKFNYSPIHVSRYHIGGCDLFQTIYYPSPALDIYRATLTGSLLTIEGTKPVCNHEFEAVLTSFGITNVGRVTPLDTNHKQSFGKIAPVPDGPRKALLHRLTQEYGIYSLGRFATWRNILLDDVYDDIGAIRKMQTLNQYDVNIERTKL